MDTRLFIGVIGIVGTIGVSLLVFALCLWRGLPLTHNRAYQQIKAHHNRLIWGGMICYTLVFSTLALLKFQSYNMGTLDLGNFDQSLWNTLQGRVLYFTYDGWGPDVSLFSIHIEPIHLLVAPLYLLWADARIILILQTIIIVAGTVPVFYMARDYFGKGLLSLVFPVSYLLFPTLQFANLFDYHGDTLAMSFLLFTFWFLHRRRFYPYLIFLVLSLMCKEYIALLALALGVYAWRVEDQRRLGIVTILLAFFWIAGVNTGLHYIFAGKATPFIAPRAYEIGRTPFEIIASLLSNPITALRDTLTVSAVGASLLMLVSTGFLALLGYRFLWVALPIYGGLMLFAADFDIRSHHPTTLIPVIVISALYGANRLIQWVKTTDRIAPSLRERFPGALTGYLLSCAVCATVILGPSPLSWQFWDPDAHGHGRYYFGSLYRYQKTDHDQVADRFIKMIPPDAVVCASSHLSPHLTHRETCYTFPVPEGLARADYLLIDVNETYMNDSGIVTPNVSQREETHQTVARLLSATDLSLIAYEDGLFLFKRASDRKSVSFFSVTESDPTAEDTAGRPLEVSAGLHLLNQSLIPQKNGSTLFSRTWQVTQPIDKPIFLVTVLHRNGEEYRVLHIPSLLLRSVNTWLPGKTYTEQFMITLPAEWQAPDLRQEIRGYQTPQNDALFFRDGTVIGKVPL